MMDQLFVVLEPPAEESTRDRMIGIADDAHDLAVLDLRDHAADVRAVSGADRPPPLL